MASVAYNFEQLGVLNFKGASRDAVEEALIMGDVDVREVTEEEGDIQVLVAPGDLEKAKECLKDLSVSDYDRAETTMYPNEWIEVEGEDLKRLQDIMAQLDECEDVQAVYSNVDNI